MGETANNLLIFKLKSYRFYMSFYTHIGFPTTTTEQIITEEGISGFRIELQLEDWKLHWQGRN